MIYRYRVMQTWKKVNDKFEGDDWFNSGSGSDKRKRTGRRGLKEGMRKGSERGTHMNEKRKRGSRSMKDLPELPLQADANGQTPHWRGGFPSAYARGVNVYFFIEQHDDWKTCFKLRSITMFIYIFFFLHKTRQFPFFRDFIRLEKILCLNQIFCVEMKVLFKPNTIYWR